MHLPSRLFPAAAGFSQGAGLRHLVEGTTEPVLVTDAGLDRPGPVIRYVNAAFTRLTGWAAKDLIGWSPRLLQGAGTDPATIARISAALRRREPVEARILNYTREARPYWVDLRIVPLFDPRGRVDGFAGCVRPVETAAEPGFDALTALPDRAMLLQLGAELRAAAPHRPLAVALLDVDGLGALNARAGREAGDALLRGIADMAGESVRATDIAGCLGGGRFAVVLPGAGLAEAATVAERLRRMIAGTAFRAEGHAIRVTLSAGVAEALPAEPLEALLDRAAVALDAAKRAGRDRVVAAEEPRRRAA